MFPKDKIPYFVYAPSYTYKSSGVMTLHFLVHALNEAGERAYLIPDNPDGYATHPELNTPLVQTRIDQNNYYYNNGIDPIVVYPDIVKGNPCGAKRVVRYLLAPAGAFGGSSVFPETDKIWGALPSIAKNVLRIPVSDPDIFWADDRKRSGSCYYAHKYETLHKNELLPITNDSSRLEGTREHLAALLRSSAVCYLYELSSVITEAALCGCPVVLVRTPYFNTIDPDCMMGNVSWSDGERVKNCDYYMYDYLFFKNEFLAKLKDFIKDTQEWS